MIALTPEAEQVLLEVFMEQETGPVWLYPDQLEPGMNIQIRNQKTGRWEDRHHVERVDIHSKMNPICSRGGVHVNGSDCYAGEVKVPVKRAKRPSAAQQGIKQVAKKKRNTRKTRNAIKDGADVLKGVER